MLTLSLKKKYFDAIKAGIKTVEGRLNSPKFKDLKPGMNIVFKSTDSDEDLTCKVESLNVYPNFEIMLQKEGLEKMLPGIKTIEEGNTIYESFPGYKDKVKEIGALAIRLKILTLGL